MTIEAEDSAASGLAVTQSPLGTSAVLSIERFRPLAGGLDHPEGVAWDALAGVVYAGGEAGQVYSVGLDGSVKQIAVTGGFILGIAVDGEGLIYACDVGRAAVVRIDPRTGRWETYSRPAQGQPPMVAPNWLAFDGLGRLYVTDSGNWNAADGKIWRLEPGGEAHVWTTQSTLLPNGCCLDATGSFLYVIETNLPGVVRLPITANGAAGPRELVAELPDTTPDGIALAADGSLLVSCYRPDAVYRLAPGERPELLVHDLHGQTLGAPANVAFAGPNLDVLVTSNLGRWHVAIGDLAGTGLVGEPLPRPRIPRT